MKTSLNKQAVQMILANINRHIFLTKEEIQIFTDKLSFRKVKNKEIIQAAGMYCKDSFFVTKGCLRAFQTDQNGFDHVLSFAPADYWVSDLYALISGNPAILNVEATSPSEVLILNRADQEKLYLEVPKFERFFRIILEKSLVHFQQRILDNLQMNSEERYQKFCEKYPQLVGSLAQKQIASYIGVTPEFFSKMRTRMLRKN
ncbi:MAG: Crp/Fnr family transcriptional regulator [Saprospiraceae bacterium]|nr:Crp/Fnr family transcriptional regulator [Saprospiraceae bacterium]